MSARFEVVHGQPTDEELAVVVSLLSAAAAAPADHAPRPRSNWGRPVMRRATAGEPGAWWRSGLPRP